MTDFYQGQTAEFTVTFVAADGSPLDPPDVQLRLLPPERYVVEYSLGAATVTRVSAGLYRCYVLLDRPGIWRYRWKGTSTPVAVSGGQFSVADDLLA